MAVVSPDHGSENLNSSQIRLTAGTESKGCDPRPFSPADVRGLNQHDMKKTSGDRRFFGVVDGFVCDCSDFVNNMKAHPGGIKKLLATNHARIGATGEDYGFSFTRGRNAHFPRTGKAFQDGVRKYLQGKANGESGFLAPCEVVFEQYGKIVIVGKLVVPEKATKETAS